MLLGHIRARINKIILINQPAKGAIKIMGTDSTIIIKIFIQIIKNLVSRLTEDIREQMDGKIRNTVNKR